MISYISIVTFLLPLTLLSFQYATVHSFQQSTKVLMDTIRLRLNSGNFDGYRQTATKTGAYEIAASSKIVMPCIILVNPFLDQNVGSVSRAMLNFGLTELRVVDPRCDILSESARALAAGSVQILENAKVFPTLKECVADLQRVMATTVRPRHMTQMVYTPSAASKIAISQDSEVKVGIYTYI
jgi:tRNA G18 (ribose-2'-O)-methylase SpoU